VNVNGNRATTSPNDWKMNATDRRRTFTSSSSDIADTSCPSITTVPEVGWSRPPRMLRSVVLPEPDRPRTATSSPGSAARDTPRRAWITMSPDG
jgi:hypothetical protein